MEYVIGIRTLMVFVIACVIIGLSHGAAVIAEEQEEETEGKTFSHLKKNNQRKNTIHRTPNLSSDPVYVLSSWDVTNYNYEGGKKWLINRAVFTIIYIFR